MSGFDNAKVDDEFFVHRGWKSNFLINIGHGDPAALPPRAPRLEFAEAADIL
jgi:3-hydroxypropanoate dehydrogenase